MPGPRAPPERRRPSLKMTALSYSLTTFTVTRRLRGKVTRTRRSDRMVIRMAHRPGQSDEHLVTKNNVINDK